MAKMTSDEYQRFITYGTRTAKLATVRADGHAHVAPVWFVLDGEDIVFTTGANTIKARNMRRDPRVTLCVDDQTPPYAHVIVEGVATMTRELEPLRHWATRIGGRYMGADRAEEYGRRNGVPGELLVRVSPTRVIAEKEIAN